MADCLPPPTPTPTRPISCPSTDSRYTSSPNDNIYIVLTVGAQLFYICSAVEPKNKEEKTRHRFGKRCVSFRRQEEEVMSRAPLTVLLSLPRNVSAVGGGVKMSSVIAAVSRHRLRLLLTSKFHDQIQKRKVLVLWPKFRRLNLRSKAAPNLFGSLVLMRRTPHTPSLYANMYSSS